MRSKTIGSATASDNTGGATADYNTIADWENSIADTDSETGTVITQVNPTDTSAVTLNASLTSGRTALLTADGTVNFNAATYSRHTACARINISSGATALTIGAANWTVEKIAIMGASNQTIRITSATTINRLGVRSATFYAIFSSAGITASNIMIMRGGAGCITWYHDSGTINAYQCSIYSPSSGAGFYNNGTAFNCYGCVVQGPASNYVSCSGNYNVSQDTSAPGATTVKSDSGVYTNSTAGSENYALTSSTTYAIVNRSGFPSDTDTDIVGTTRPSTGADAGVWQNVSTPSGPAPIDNTKVSRRGTGRTIPTPTAIGI